MTKDVQDIYAPEFVKDLFDKCSGKYIWFSYVCSFGFTERWRKQCIKFLGDLPDMAEGYDLMAGTGEAWPHLLRAHPSVAKISAIDISKGMHDLALERLHEVRADKIDFIQDNVLSSALQSNSTDFIISTFGLKTFSSNQHKTLAKLVAQTLKPGGKFSFIEASDPKRWIFRPFYRFYLNRVLPLIESVFLKGAQDFTMIRVYTAEFQNAQGFANALRDEGLEVTDRKVMFGCASGVSGSKPI